MTGKKIAPAKYLSQDFRAAFEGQPYIDRDAAAMHLREGRAAILKERELVAEIEKLELVKKLRKARSAVKHHARELQKTLANADPLRSP